MLINLEFVYLFIVQIVFVIIRNRFVSVQIGLIV